MDKKSAEQLAKAIAVTCVRNGFLEDLHAGKVPISQAGDYSDVTLVTPERTILWNELSRLDDGEMKRLMQEIVNKLYTVFRNLENPEFMSALLAWGNMNTAKWDKPKELDNFVLPKGK